MIKGVGVFGSPVAGSAIPAAWAPSDQAGLQLWLTPSGIAQTAGNIDTWTDQSSNAHVLTPVDVAPQLSSASARFVGTGHLAVASHASLNVGVANFILAFRVKFDNASETKMLCGKDSYNGGAYAGYFIQQSNTSIQMGVRNNGDANDNYSPNDPAGDLNDGNYHTLILVRADGLLEHYWDGVLGSSNTEAGAVNADNASAFKVGNADDQTNSMNGNIKGVLLYKATADSTLLGNINTYLEGL
jgi:hypothetical protein